MDQSTGTLAVESSWELERDVPTGLQVRNAYTSVWPNQIFLCVSLPPGRSEPVVPASWSHRVPGPTIDKASSLDETKPPTGLSGGHQVGAQNL